MIRSPQKYLEAYIKGHFEGFQSVKIHPHDRGAYADCMLRVGSHRYEIRLLLPRDAPTKRPHPLLAGVRSDEHQLWSYKRDYKDYTSWDEALMRVHLHQYRDAFFQVHVHERDGRDVIERVCRLTGASLSTELEAVIKDRIAKHWGIQCWLSGEEKKALKRLTP